MFASFLAEIFKLRKRPAMWTIIAVWMAMELLFGYVFSYFGYRTSTGPSAGLGKQALLQALPAQLPATAIQGFPVFAGALAILIGALATGSEYGWTTMKAILTQGPRRLSVIAGKMLALVVLMLVIVLITFGVDALASIMIASATQQPMNWPSAYQLAKGIGAGWLIVTMWCLGGAFLGVVLRGTALAAGLGLVWALVVENLLRVVGSLLGAVDSLQKFLPGTNAGALVAALGAVPANKPGGTPGITTAVGGTQAVIVVAIYLLAFVVAAAVLVKRRDVA